MRWLRDNSEFDADCGSVIIVVSVRSFDFVIGGLGNIRFLFLGNIFKCL